MFILNVLSYWFLLQTFATGRMNHTAQFSCEILKCIWRSHAFVKVWFWKNYCLSCCYVRYLSDVTMLAYRCWLLRRCLMSGSRDPANLCPGTSSAIWPWRAACHWMDTVAPYALRARVGLNLFSRSLRTMTRFNNLCCYVIGKEEVCLYYTRLQAAGRTEVFHFKQSVAEQLIGWSLFWYFWFSL
jgi:hypothetical protein